jgi:hypothetical protein
MVKIYISNLLGRLLNNINIVFWIGIYNYINNYYKYLIPYKNIYRMTVDQKKIIVKEINLVKYNINSINRFINYGNYIYVSEEKLNLLNIMPQFSISDLDLNHVKLVMINRHNIKYELVLENDLVSKAGYIFFIKLLYKATYNTNIYLLIYYYLKFYLKNEDTIQSVAFNISQYTLNQSCVNINIAIDKNMKIEDL